MTLHLPSPRIFLSLKHLQSLSLLILTVLSAHLSSVYAQQAFTPLKQGEYEVREESEFFNPGIQVNGYYHAYYASFREELVNGEEISDGFLQDIELQIQSKVNTNISVHAHIGNKSKVVSEQDDPFVTDYADEQSDSTSDGAMDLEFREAYLEYNHNPNARLLIGKQFINVADRIGLIYQGNANAISQRCRIGTWCYYVGGARIGSEGDSALFWLQLDYPIYQNGVLITDPWVKSETRQEASFSVELMRVDYQGSKIPMSSSGMWIGEGSPYQASYLDGTTRKYVYFDNDEVQYMGFNIKWDYYDFLLRFDWINLAGKRDYFSRDAGGAKEYLSKKEVAGNVYNLEMDLRVKNNWNTGLTFFAATGNEAKEDTANFWERNSSAYMEVQKGDFGDALIYFNGKKGLGQGHSVSNLVFYALRTSYFSDKRDVKVDFAAYSFKRNQPVYYYDETGDREDKSAEIGSELDLAIDWKLEERLKVGAQIAYFIPGNAYSANDNIRPTKDPEDFSLIGLKLQYDF